MCIVSGVIRTQEVIVFVARKDLSQIYNFRIPFTDCENSAQSVKVQYPFILRLVRTMYIETHQTASLLIICLKRNNPTQTKFWFTCYGTNPDGYSTNPGCYCPGYCTNRSCYTLLILTLIPFTDWAYNAHSEPFEQSKSAH